MVRKHHRRHVQLIAPTVAVAAALACAAANADVGISKPLTSQPGDAQRGKAVAVDSNRGNCTICHRLPIDAVPPSASGDLGPSLSGVGARFTAAQLRQRIVDARSLNPETLMPAYYVTQGLQRVQAKYAGQPILRAQEVEDLVAFLATLQ